MIDISNIAVKRETLPCYKVSGVGVTNKRVLKELENYRATRPELEFDWLTAYNDTSGEIIQRVFVGKTSQIGYMKLPVDDGGMEFLNVISFPSSVVDENIFIGLNNFKKHLITDK